MRTQTPETTTTADNRAQAWEAWISFQPDLRGWARKHWQADLVEDIMFEAGCTFVSASSDRRQHTYFWAAWRVRDAARMLGLSIRKDRQSGKNRPDLLVGGDAGAEAMDRHQVAAYFRTGLSLHEREVLDAAQELAQQRSRTEAEAIRMLRAGWELTDVAETLRMTRKQVLGMLGSLGRAFQRQVAGAGRRGVAA